MFSKNTEPVGKIYHRLVYLHVTPEGPQGEGEKSVSDLLAKKSPELDKNLKNVPEARKTTEKYEAGEESVKDSMAQARLEILKSISVGKTVQKPEEKEHDENEMPKGDINPYEKIPKPPENAPSGKQIMEMVKQLPPEQRQNFLAEQFKSGNITVKFYPITEQLKDAKGNPILGDDGKPIVATRYVSGPIAFGAKDPVYYPVAGVTASVGAARIGCVLPTAKTVLDMEKDTPLIPYISYEQVADESGVPKADQARYEYHVKNGKREKSPKGSLMRDPKMYEAHDRLTQEEMKKMGLKAGDRFHGASKTIIASPVIENRDEEAIFGGRHASNGKIVQPAPVYQGPHEGRYHDFTNMAQYFVHEKMEITLNGKKHIVSTRDILECGKEEKMPDGTKKIKTVLGRTDLHGLVSNTGPMNVKKMYKNTKGIDNPPVIIDIPIVEVERTSASAPSSEKPVDKLPGDKQAEIHSEPGAPSPSPSVPDLPGRPTPPSVAEPEPVKSAPAVHADTPSTPHPPEPSPSPGHGNFSAPSLSRPMPAAEEPARKLESIPVPNGAGTVLGDSYMAGALKFITKGPRFKNYPFHGNSDPNSDDSKVGKSLTWMKGKLSQILPDLKQGPEKPAVAMLGGINDVLVDLSSEKDLEQKYQEIITNYEAMFTMAHQNNVRVVAATIPPLGQFIRQRFQDPEAQKLHFRLWEKVNAYLVNHEGKPNGPDKLVRLDREMADREDNVSIAREYANREDPLHPNTEGKKYMGQMIQRAMAELEKEEV